jgi:nitrate reductase assembly molybdenum cofactor insertion protein NarJ
MLCAASALDLIAQLFEYPTAGYQEKITEVAEALRAANTRVADLIAAFGDAVAERSLSGMEELYIQTFDLNPDACLDIGWHLFGEDYARGEFLVKMRQEMRRYGVAERDELPDSLLSALPLVARMPEDEAAIFRTRFLLPAVEKLRKAVPADTNPFASLCAALVSLLTVETAEGEQQGGGTNE